MLIRSLSILLLCAGALWAQRSDTVAYRLFTNATASSVSSQIRNIGQSQHLFFVQLTDNGGTCSAVAGGMYEFFLEGSFDNVSYIRISSQGVMLNTGATASTFEGFGFANGAFPYLRARFLFNYVNCKVNAWYTGTVPTAAFPQLPRAASTGYAVATLRPATIGSFPIIANLNAATRIVVYGLFVYNPVATANSVLLTYGDGTCTSLTGLVADLTNMQGYAQTTWPTSLVPYSIGPEAKYMCLTTSAATQLNATVIYRME